MYNMHCFPRNLQGPQGPWMSLGAYWITKCFVFQGILRGPLDKPCSVSSVQLFKTSLGLEWEQYYRQPILNQSLKVLGDPLGCPRGSLGGSQITRCSISLVSGGSLGVPSTNLVQFSSFQFSCSKHRWGSSGSNTTRNQS